MDMVSCQKMVNCSLQLGGESLLQAEEFRYLHICPRLTGKWCGLFSNIVDVVLDHCDSEGAWRKALNCPVDLYSNTHLWSWALGSDRNNKVKISFLDGLRDRVKSSDIRRELWLLLLHQLIWMPPLKVAELAEGIKYPMCPGKCPGIPCLATSTWSWILWTQWMDVIRRVSCYNMKFIFHDDLKTIFL